MATTGLPPPPINDAPGSFTWLEWYRQLRDYISTSGSVPWYIINFANSNLTDIQNRDHNVLDNIQGGSVGERYHLTKSEYENVKAGGGGGGTTEHNNLQGLQGGTTTERYHLTNTEHDWVVTGSTAGTIGTVTNVTGTAPIQVANPTTTPVVSIDPATQTTPGSLSAADKAKLDGIAPGAQPGTITNIATSGAITGGPITTTGTISHNTTDGFLHVPATSTTSNGKVLQAGSTAGSGAWTDPSWLPLIGGTLTGPLNTQGAQGEIGTIRMVPDVGTPGADVMEIDSQDGLILRAPYIVIDTDNPILTMPGPQVGSTVVVAGIDPFGGAQLGYAAPPVPDYFAQATTTLPVVIKAAGTTPPTPWVDLGLTITLTEDIVAGTATAMFDMLLSNSTNRTGVIEFGLRVNGVDFNREVTQQIPANFLSTIAISVPLLNAYSTGDVLKLIARVTTNSNDGFALTMAASASDPSVFRFFTGGGGGASLSDTPPLMDGVAAAGTSGAASRGDHVHPSDTSKVNKSGDIMTGPLTLSSAILRMDRPSSATQAEYIGFYNDGNTNLHALIGYGNIGTDFTVSSVNGLINISSNDSIALTAPSVAMTGNLTINAGANSYFNLQSNGVTKGTIVSTPTEFGLLNTVGNFTQYTPAGTNNTIFTGLIQAASATPWNNQGWTYGIKMPFPASIVWDSANYRLGLGVSTDDRFSFLSSDLNGNNVVPAAVLGATGYLTLNSGITAGGNITINPPGLPSYVNMYSSGVYRGAFAGLDGGLYLNSNVGIALSIPYNTQDVRINNGSLTVGTEVSCQTLNAIGGTSSLTAANVTNAFTAGSIQSFGALNGASQYISGSSQVVGDLQGGRIQSYVAGNPMFEMHYPGVAAAAMYLGTNIIYWSTTNGAGVSAFIRATLDTAGNFVATGTITPNGSDARLKDKITRIDNPLDRLTKITGYDFEWKPDLPMKGSDTGFIAQEIQEVFPQMVTKSAIGRTDDSVDPEYLGIALGNQITALLVESVKELNTKLDNALARIQELESR